MNKILALSIFILLLLSGCSSRQYYEPNDSSSLDVDSINLDSTIIDLNNDGATLENYSYVSKIGVLNHIKKGYKFLNYNQDTLIASDNNASIYIKNDESEIILTFDSNIVSATKFENLLAFGTVNNSINLYDIKKKEILFKEYLKPSILNNIKIANPIFLNSVVLYPTLDGKVVIVDIKDKTIVKTINIDPKSDINNIIFLDQIGDALVAATSKKLFTFVNGKVNIKEFDIQSIVIDTEFIYVATLDGEIVKYNIELKQLASQKFKFAKINALAIGKYLYAVESQGYLLRVNKDFKAVKVFDFSYDEKEKVIAIKNKIYFEDEYIILE
jgi:uncharacterized protein YcfL